MTLRPSFLLAVLAGICLLILALLASRLHSAQKDLSAVEARLALAADQARELLDLRTREETISLGQRPREDLLAQLNAALGQLAIPARLTSLQQESDRELSGAEGLRRQAMRLTLQPIEPADLGRFLDRWQSAQSIWTPTSIELTRLRAMRDGSTGYAATLRLAATYIDDRSSSQ